MSGLSAIARGAAVRPRPRRGPRIPADPLEQSPRFLGLGRSLTFPHRQWRARDPQRTVFFDEGEGPPLVLVHGLGGNATHFELILGPLLRHHRVIGLDLLGCGWTDKPHVTYSAALLRRHLEQFLDFAGLGQVSLVGHSMGAGLSTWLALEQPERVRALGLISPVGLTPLPLHLRLGGPLMLRQALLQPLFRHGSRAMLAQNFVASERQNPRVRWFLDSSVRDEPHAPNVRDFARVSATLVRDLLRLDLSARLARLRAPVLALFGEGDRLVAPLRPRVEALLPGARTAVVRGSGHLPMVEQPEQTLAELEPFLRRHAR